MIHSGDLFDVLPTLDAESVDACVTDPPYDLTANKKGGSGAASVNLDSPYGRARIGTGNGAGGFMGMKWDGTGVTFKPETWREVFRVLKPGAYLCAFGATRTYHRMTCAIEDAGFEIRDSFLYWGFGSGFPKSLNVSNDPKFCQCANERGEHGSSAVSSLRASVDASQQVSGDAEQDVLPSLHECATEQTEEEAIWAALEYGVRDVREEVSPSTEPPASRQATDLLTPMQWEDSRTGVGTVQRQYEGPQTIGPAIRSDESSMEGRRDVLSEARELQADQIHQVPAATPFDGAEGRLCNGASADHGDVDRAPIAAGRSSTPRRSRPAEQREGEPGTLADEQQPQAARRWPLCDRCGKSVVPSGLGTALKPAYEPIVVARKPFRGSVAENVEKYGTAALNVDACRIPFASENDQAAAAAAAAAQRAGQDQNAGRTCYGDFADGPGSIAPYLEKMDLGRWPANVILDEAAAAALDEMTGELQAGASPPKKGLGSARVFGDADRAGVQKERVQLDAGGASRFYYVAKPSREERDFGTKGLAVRPRDDSRKEGNPGGDNPRNRGLQPRGNFHPTVKPVELMRWLVKLVTPPGGLVLDPFTGSGTTGMACRYEHRRFIGIEREAEYVAIAERRIAAVAPLFGDAQEGIA